MSAIRDLEKDMKQMFALRYEMGQIDHALSTDESLNDNSEKAKLLNKKLASCDKLFWELHEKWFG